MQRLVTLALAAANANIKMERGKLDVPKGRQLRSLRLKVQVPINNTTGGTLTTGLSDAQKQALFALLLCSLTYGKNGTHKPFSAVDFTRIHREFRYLSNSEIEGYNDTTTGLNRSMANSATTTVTFYMPIPTGIAWFFDRRNFWGVGRSQAKTLELELRRGATDTIASGIAINGTVTIDVMTDLSPCKGDRWTWLPEYIEQDETDKTVRLPDGLPLRISERSAVHASSVLTNITVKVDDDLVHDQVSPAETITEYNDSPLLSSAGSITDRETMILALNEVHRVQDLATGAPVVVQNSKDLATFKAGYLYVPVKSQDAIEAEIENVAWNVRKKMIRAVSSADADGFYAIPARLRPFVSMVFFDEDDAEFEKYPGYVCAPGHHPEITVPSAVKEAAVAKHAALKASGSNKAAESVIREVANVVPGAVQSGRGYSRGASNVLSRVRGFFPS